MHFGRTTLSKFLIQQSDRVEGASDLAALLIDVAAAVKAISAMTAKGSLGGVLARVDSSHAHTTHAHTDTQVIRLDLLASEEMLRSCEWGGLVAGMASEELDAPYAVPEEFTRGRYLLIFDPLDGSYNSDVNASVGTIFSVLRHDKTEAPTMADYLQPGSRQVAAGYAIYGPATMLVITVGKGTHGFTLDREIGNFILTHPDLQVPADTSEIAINTSNARFWESPINRYVSECQAGRSGERARDFNLRWIASTVAEVHHILMRGGVFMYPKDTHDAAKPGRLRQIYEANPISLLIEQAGGRASTGRRRVLDMEPESLHHRIPVIIGSRNEVERVDRYHAEFDCGADRPYTSPLFNERSLFRPEWRA